MSQVLSCGPFKIVKIMTPRQLGAANFYFGHML